METTTPETHTIEKEILGHYQNIREIEDQITGLKNEAQENRDAISILVAELPDQKLTVPGIATFANRAPSVQQRWDGKALEDLIKSLRETGHGDIADEIAGCKKTIAVDGSLAITPNKQKKISN